MKFRSINLLIIFLVAISLSGCLKTQEQEEIMPAEFLPSKKAVLVIAYQGFQDFEYSETRRVLEKAGIEILIASSAKGSAQGKLGQSVTVDKTIDEVKVEDLDALVFIGGPGALAYVDDASAHQLARSAVAEGKVLAAICIAPEILAKAGVLKGKQATVWSSPVDQSPRKVLEEGGAEYLDQAVVVDEKIITGNGPSAASEFGQKIAEALGK
ncbi:DJ-1/PfpI family protein [Patescibacteria group bacterium]|nr:DJ-1/PfpI family protein [Patescibacteria group bacterium]